MIEDCLNLASTSIFLFLFLFLVRDSLFQRGYRRCEVWGVRFPVVPSFADQEPNKCEAFKDRPHKVLVRFQDLSSVKFSFNDLILYE